MINSIRGAAIMILPHGLRSLKSFKIGAAYFNAISQALFFSSTALKIPMIGISTGTPSKSKGFYLDYQVLCHCPVDPNGCSLCS